jgi:hypothetical protein
VGRGGMVIRDVAMLVCALIFCMLFGLTASLVVFAPVVLPSHWCSVSLVCASCCAQVSTIPAHLFLLLVVAPGSLYNRITMISKLIGYKKLTLIVKMTAGGKKQG